MSLNVQPPLFRNGDSVYVLLRTLRGTPGHHEAIVLEQENGLYTLAAHVRGPDDRPTWVIIPRQSPDKLGSEPRQPAKLANRIDRGALCHYVTADFIADAAILDYVRIIYLDGKERPVYDIAYRSPCGAGWKVAKNIDPDNICFRVYVNPTGAGRPVIE